MEFDPVLLSRIQFAFCVSFHIIFPSFTIGLASWLAVIEWRYLKTGDEVFRTIYLFWSKIFAVAFGMGVVSGVTMAYQFGTNWSHFSDAVGNVMGPLLGYEALTAFFLEATFLGIMLFGWGRVSPRMHFASTVLVAFGTLLSTFWIISANSWMQTPAGFRIEDGIFYPEDWIAVIFNPSMPYRLVHMVLAAYLTTSLAVAGVAAWYLLRGRFVSQARVMLSYALWFIAITAPLQLVAGDMHGLNAFEHQPAKVAAMEGRWDTMEGAPLVLFALPSEELEANLLEVGIPKMASFILTHEMDGVVPGLKDWSPEDRPPVGWVFWCFRIMVGLGILMIVMGLSSLYLRYTGRLYDTRWFLQFCTWMTPSGFIAVLTGWFVAEIGRQPWVVYEALRTAEASSPVPGYKVAISLAIFVVVYSIVFGAGTYYIVRLVRKGPEDPDSLPPADGAPSGDPGAGMRPFGAGMKA